jgi:hypothetical protein
MMVMMVIEGDVLAIAEANVANVFRLSQSGPAEVDISPATGQIIPIDHLHHHHLLSTHQVAAPPRLLGLFMRRRPSTIRALLVRQ